MFNREKKQLRTVMYFLSDTVTGIPLFINRKLSLRIYTADMTSC